MEYSFCNKEIVLNILRQIEKSILMIQEWNVEVNSVDDYLLSPNGMKNLAATSMLLEAIGEGFKKIGSKTNKELLHLRPEIPWKDVMGMRDHIAHGYFDIDADVIFYAVKDDLTPLLEAVRFFIEELKISE